MNALKLIRNTLDNLHDFETADRRNDFYTATDGAELGWTGFTEREIANLARHDKRRHKGHFDPSTMSCKYRKRLQKIHQLDKADRLTAFSDVHQSGLENVEIGDDSGVILLAGDIFPYGKNGKDTDKAKAWFEKTFVPWCEKHKDKQIVMIGGNHDSYLRDNEKTLKMPPNVTYLNDRAAEVNGLRMYGTSWTPYNQGGAWEGDPKTLGENFKKIPYGLDVLITHAPPRIEGSNIDWDDKMGLHFGSPELTKEIIRKKPKLVLCGHVHVGSHRPIIYGDTIIMNVSRIGRKRDTGKHTARTIGVDRSPDGRGFLIDAWDDTLLKVSKPDATEG